MKQVILCVETNKQANTDVGYIDAVIKNFTKLVQKLNYSISILTVKGDIMPPSC
jgi:hypothetical protein